MTFLQFMKSLPHPRDHIALGFGEGLFPFPTPQNLAIEFWNLLFLAQHEGVIIGNDDARSAWAAAGSEDTELGVLMELEVGHGATEIYARVQA